MVCVLIKRKSAYCLRNRAPSSQPHRRQATIRYPDTYETYLENIVVSIVGIVITVSVQRYD